MHAVVGPILLKKGRYAFDLWTPEEGLSRGYAYRRIEDAHYARNAEIRSRRQGRSGAAVACSTLDEFTLAVTEREATFRPGHEPRSQSAQPHSSPRTPPSASDRGRPRSIAAYSPSGTPASSSSSHTVALASEGARQSPRGDNEPPEEIFGPFGTAERLNWLSWKKR